MNFKISKNDKKNYIIVVTILLYGIIMGVLFFTLRPVKEEKKLNDYIILNGENFYQYDDEQIKTISMEDTDFSDNPFRVYSSNKYSGEFYFSPSSSDYQYTKFYKGKTSNAFVPERPFIALTDKIDYVEFEKEELSKGDIDDLEQLMNNKNIYDIGSLFNSYKVNLDIDNDDEDETIYVGSNYDYQNVENNMFSIIYVKDGYNREILEEYYYTPDNYMEFIRCDLSYILDFNSNGNYTLVVSSSDIDMTINNFYVKNNSYYKNIRLD